MFKCQQLTSVAAVLTFLLFVHTTHRTTNELFSR